MKKKHKLLFKFIPLYLMLIFITFYGSGLFLTNEADEFIFNSLEDNFKLYEKQIYHNLKKGRSLNRIKYADKIILVDSAYAAGISTLYSDTIIVNEEFDSEELFKKKSTIISVEGKYYKVEMLYSMEDFLRLRNDIFDSLIPAFLILAIILIGTSLLLSNYFFRPFYKILNLMKNYRVEQRNVYVDVETTTYEFDKMQSLFKDMINSIESDYRKLKEYTENMAHEIQTPLAIIRNKTENLLSDESLMKLHEESVKAIYNETNYLSRLGVSLNLLTKIENNEFNHPQLLNTKAVIKNHVDLVEEMLKLKSISIELNLFDKHRFFIDPVLLGVVVKNLLTNAVNYSEEFGTIRVESTDNSLSVVNSGHKLDFNPENIFDRFNKSKASKHSVGLGLAIVKKICDLNEIDISYKYENEHHYFILLQNV